MAPVAAAPLCRRRRADRWCLRNGASSARRLCRWLEPALLRSGRACVDEPGLETIGAIGNGPAATVAMSRATWAAIVVRVCGRCGVVGGLDRDVGGSNRGVGGHSRVVGGSDRSGVAGAAAWAAGTAAWAAGTEAYRRCYGAEVGGELGSWCPGGGGRWFEERFQSLRVQHLAADWVDQQPVGGQEV